jgi:glycosyltransferase involved in cell wall biosynthesis
MGKPCVSFDIDGAPEVVIPGQTGYLVRPGDSAGLADALIRLIADPCLRKELGEAGRKRVDPDFRAETMVHRIAAVYETLLQKHAARVARFEGRRLPRRVSSSAAPVPAGL